MNYAVHPSIWYTLFLAMAASMVLTFIVSPHVIDILRRLKAGQVIQKDGPQSHQTKAGTPTMGGIAIIVGMLVPAFLLVRGMNPRGLWGFYGVVALTLVYALIGLVDDWLTMHPRNGKRGLSSKVKFLVQFVAAVAFAGWLYRTGHVSTYVRFDRFFAFDLKWAYWPLVVLLVTGMSNFINITDGLDGLASGLTAIIAATLAIVPLILNVGDYNASIVVLLAALSGACIAFLWFNYNPAKVFMGDTGSMAIGALIPAVAIVTKLEVVMVIAGMVFILDGLSSALQWAVFKYTRIRTGTGKRIFRMSPVHHHFEMSGWPEQLVVIRFWVIGVFCSLVAVLAVMQGMLK